MHQVNDAIVSGGKIVLTNVPFADGQRVTVVVSDSVSNDLRLPIAEVRRQLGGAAQLLDDPDTPMIPSGDWEMLK